MQSIKERWYPIDLGEVTPEGRVWYRNSVIVAYGADGSIDTKYAYRLLRRWGTDIGATNFNYREWEDGKMRHIEIACRALIPQEKSNHNLAKDSV